MHEATGSFLSIPGHPRPGVRLGRASHTATVPSVRYGGLPVAEGAPQRRPARCGTGCRSFRPSPSSASVNGPIHFDSLGMCPGRFEDGLLLSS